MDNFEEITERKSLKERMFQPYSDEELTELLADDPWGAIFYGLYYQILKLIQVAINLKDVVQGKTPASENASCSDLLYPNNDPSGNYLDALIRKWRDLMLKVRKIKIPTSCYKVANSVTRLFASFVKKLTEIRPSGLLRKAQYAFERIFGYLAEDSRAPSNDLEYEQLIRKLFDELLESLKLNATDMCTFEAEIRHNLSRVYASAALKRATKASRFDEGTAEHIKAIWDDEQENQYVQSMCGKGHVTYAAVFEHKRRSLARFNIHTLHDFVRCLESARNRRNYRIKNPKKTEK